MITHPYFGPGNVVIDSCEHCELVWLDFGELQQIVDAPGKDRGTRQVPRRVVEEGVGSPHYRRSNGRARARRHAVVDLARVFSTGSTSPDTRAAL